MTPVQTMTSAFATLLPLPSETPAYLGLARGIRGMVMDGRLATGGRLPSERAMAETLALSRATVTRAYGELVATGWAVPRQGSGTTVRVPVAERTPSLPLVPNRHDAGIDLSAAAGLAPEGTADVVARALEWLPATLAGAGYEPYGAGHLRVKIAEWYETRGVPTSPDQVVVTAGAMTAVSVALHALTRPGDRVAVDSPTYPGALGALQAVRARALPVPLADGWDLAAWAAAVRRGRPRAAYLIGDFHNPTGLYVPDDVRVGLTRLLADAGTTLVVDETTAELDFGEFARARPFAAVDDTVVSVGSLSKVLWGGFRIGWLRCPGSLVDVIRKQAGALSLGPSALDQLVATSYLENPAPIRDAVVSRLSTARGLWRDALAARLPDWSVPAPPGGLGLWVTLPDHLSTELALAARTHGVTLAPGPTFSPDRVHTNRVRLPLTLPLDTISEAVDRLAAAWADAVAGGRGGASLETLAL